MSNILESLDKMLTGTLDYLFSILSSFWALFRRPIQAPARLTKKLFSQKFVQASGFMLLVFSYALIFCLVVPFLTSLSASFTTARSVPGLSVDNLLPDRGGNFSFVATLPFLLGGVVSAAMIDTLNRAALTLLQVPRRRSNRLRTMLHFANAIAPVSVGLVILVVALDYAFGFNLILSSDLVSMLFLLFIYGASLVALLRGGWAAAYLLTRGVLRGRAVAHRLVQFLALFVYTGAFLGSTMIGLSIASQVGERMNEEITPELLYRDCQLDDGQAVATLAFTTEASHPQQIDLEQKKKKMHVKDSSEPVNDEDRAARRHSFRAAPGQPPIAEPDRAVTFIDRVDIPERLKTAIFGCSVTDP